MTASARAARRVEWKKSLDRLVGVPAQRLLHALDALRSTDPAPSNAPVRRVVLLKLWGLGNLTMILPYVDAIRRRFPDASVEFVTLSRNQKLVEGHPGITRVWTLRDQGVFKTLTDVGRVVRALRSSPVDVLLDFEQFLRLPGLLAWAGRVRQAIGLDTPGQHRARLHQARVPYDHGRHMRDVFGDVVRAAGVITDDAPPLYVPRSKEGRDAFRAQMPEHAPRPWILMHPGSGDNFPGRRWPVERFAQLATTLGAERGGTLLLSGTHDERPLLQRLADAASWPHQPVVDLGGRLDLSAWIEALADVDLVVTNDTGPVHLASAVETPLVALYGPNTPAIYGPLGPHARALYHRLPCSPCLTNLNGKTSACRLPACIEALSHDEVADACRALLDVRRTVVTRRPTTSAS